MAQTVPAGIPQAMPKDLNPSEPKMKIEPEAAVIELRQLVKNLWNGKPQEETSPTKLKQAHNHIASAAAGMGEKIPAAISRRKNLETNLMRTQSQTENARHFLARAKSSTTNKKTQEILAQLELSLNYATTYSSHAREYSTSLSNDLQRISKHHQVIGDWTIALGGYFTETQSPPPQSSIERMHLLVQALPTFEGAFLTPAENVLHAIVTICANNGYVHKKA